MILRFATCSDYAAMLEIYKPYVEETTVSFEYVAPALSQFSARMDALSGIHPIIVCVDNGNVIGYAYSSPAFVRTAYSWCADISVYVRNDMLGRGVGSALTFALCRMLKAAGYRKAYSLITEGNERSIAMHTKSGFNKTAYFPEQGFKHGKWIGVYWLEKILNDQTVSIAFPKKINEISSDFCNEVLRLAESRIR